MRSLATARLTIRRFVRTDLDDVIPLLDGCFVKAPRAALFDWLRRPIAPTSQMFFLLERAT